MSDPYFHLSNAWQSNFYQQYMQQHGAMTQWLQQAHRYLGNHCPCPVNWKSNGSHGKPSPAKLCPSCLESSSSVQSSFKTDESSEYTEVSCEENSDVDQSDEISEEGESEWEYELNVDAILAMRAAKEELKKESSASEESYVYVGEEEEYEFIELGSLRHYGYSKKKLVGQRNVSKELLLERQIMDQIYGEKSATIAGLETAMSISFENLYDKYQPPLWPIYPVCL